MIENLNELNQTITAIIHRAQEFITGPAGIGTRVFDHKAVSDLISRDDWQKYFGLIQYELENHHSLSGLIQSDSDTLRFTSNPEAAYLMMPRLAREPVTQTAYEDLIMQSEMQKEQCMLSGIGNLRDNPFRVCVNVYGQMDDALLAQFPGAKEAYEKHFSQASSTSLYRYGAMISGKPALILNHELHLPYQEAGIEDPALKHAITAMMAGQLQELFSGTNAHITYGRGTGDADRDEIMAILPAEADPALIHQFEEKFKQALRDLPLSTDLPWVRQQYNALLSQVEKRMKSDEKLSPWTKEHPEEVACKAFEVMGRQMGQRQREWAPSVSGSRDQLLARLASQFDMTRAARDYSFGMLCSSIVSAGIRAAEKDLSQSVRLYTNTTPGKAESFTVPKGQLSQALEKMGYGKGTSPFFFMLGYPAEAAREVKNLVSQMPKISLAQKIHSAQSRNTDALSKKTLPKNRDHSYDL